MWPTTPFTISTIVTTSFSVSRLLAHTATAIIYDCTVDGEVLTFGWHENGIYDQEIDSLWNSPKGEALEEPLKGTRLAPAVGIVLYRQTWDSFHPHSEYRPAS